MNSRIDIEIFLIGDIKLELLNFLGESYKENFNESLSWGHFRRFQLTLSHESNWLNIIFVLLKNDENLDLIINSFKIIEKKSPLLILYNINEEKSEKQASELIQLFIEKRNKIYKGISEDENIRLNSEKINASYKYLNSIKDSLKINDSLLNTNELKDKIKYVESNSLFYKVGFIPNAINKKTKIIKKNDSNCAYNVNDEIFFIGDNPTDDSAITFNTIIELITNDYFKNYSISKEKMTIFNSVFSSSDKGTNMLNEDKETKKEKVFGNIRKLIDIGLIVFVSYIIYKIGIASE